MLAHYEYDLLKRPVGEVSVALEVGTVVHKAFEALLMGGDWKQAAHDALAELRTSDGNPAILALKLDDVESQWAALELAIERAWRTPEDWDIVSVEKELSVSCGPHEIVGRLDAVVLWNGNTWHLQHKTVPTNKPLAIYAEQQRTDWHEAVYQRMLQQGYSGVAGTLLNCIRKLSMKSAVSSPATAFQHFFLPRSDEEVDEVFKDLEQEINDIEAEQRGERRIIKNRSHCAGQYGNSICAFKDVCDGIINIESDRFETVEPRYTQATQDV